MACYCMLDFKTLQVCVFIVSNNRANCALESQKADLMFRERKKREPCTSLTEEMLSDLPCMSDFNTVYYVYIIDQLKLQGKT